MTPDQYRALAGEFADYVHDMDGWPVDTLDDFGTEISAALRTAADQLEAVQDALARHPKCDKYDDDDVVSCGWKSAVRDITWAVNHD